MTEEAKEARLARYLRMAEYYRGDLGLRWLRAAVMEGVKVAAPQER